MDYKAVQKLCNNFAPIKKELELLDFWRKYPEVESVSVRHVCEYDGEGGYFNCHYAEGIEFVSIEAQRRLTLQYFSNGYLREELESYKAGEDDDVIQVDSSDWDEVLEFTSLRCLDNKDKEYCRPVDVETEIEIWEKRAQEELLKQISEVT